MARILFVDDDPLTLETLTHAVQLFGHQAFQAGTAHEAMDKATKFCPDLIFIDMMLPDMDGLELVSSLRAQPATTDIPLLVLSAGPKYGAQERAIQAGARDYVLKPIRLQALLDVIKRYTSAV
jgi:CheY-like chemotaxis protein